jgi:extradiol dioxygenase family protein
MVSMLTNSPAGVDHATLVPFHHAFPVDDLDAACTFYGTVLGCPPGRRRTATARSFRFFGHDLIAQLAEGEVADAQRGAVGVANMVVRHIGVVLARPVWDQVWERLRAADVDALWGPEFRRVGEPREEALVLVADPFGNVIELKGFNVTRYLFELT